MPKKSTTKEFIEKSVKIHGNKYGYGASNYVGSNVPLMIECKLHGLFLQTPSHHLLNMCGCSICAGRGKQQTTESFIKKSKLVHGDKYDYSLVNYKRWDITVKIICKLHGIFIQRPNRHLFKQGCSKCKDINTGIRFNKGIKQFIIEANKVHNNKYDYSNSIYKTTHDKIEIICDIHGPFLQTPGHHINGHGCQKCSKIISKSELEFLNHINIPQKNRQIHIGIGKIKVDGIKNNTVFEFLGDFWHGNPKKFNKNEINPVLNKTYGVLYNETMDRLKLIKSMKYKVFYIWEYDWNRWKSSTRTPLPLRKF